MKKVLLVATQNRGKLTEIKALLEEDQIIIIGPNEIKVKPLIHENGKTYAENAGYKALTYAKLSGYITLADDSGLEVDILGGLPGIFSARFSELPGATDADRRIKLLENLQVYPQPWYAHFHCTIAIASPNGDIYYSEGECFGEIISEERGRFGFGYDPIFYIKELNKTMAELTIEQKNKISHRAKAINTIKPILTKLYANIFGIKN